MKKIYLDCVLSIHNNNNEINIENEKLKDDLKILDNNKNKLQYETKQDFKRNIVLNEIIDCPEKKYISVMEEKQYKLMHYSQMYNEIGQLYALLNDYIFNLISKEQLISKLDMKYINNDELKNNMYEFVKILIIKLRL